MSHSIGDYKGEILELGPRVNFGTDEFEELPPESEIEVTFIK